MRKKRRKNRRFMGMISVLAVLLGICLVFQIKERKKPQTDATVFEEQGLSEDAVIGRTEILSDLGQEDRTENPIVQETEDVEALEASALAQESARICELPAGDLAAFGLVDARITEQLFFASGIDEEIAARISGKSYTPNEQIDLSELAYLKMLYYGADGNSYVGEMIVNQAIAGETLAIFRKLYENKYPIERMALIDDYDADDETSMDANNTSAFNYRTIAGSSKLSNHSYGMAIDLNPKYNPYVKTASDGSLICQPESGREYADRSLEFDYKIDETDLAYQLFTEAGFTWGGDFQSVKDYQHFEKNP